MERAKVRIVCQCVESRSDSEYFIHDVHAEYFREFLLYCYGDAHTLTMENVVHVAIIAEKYLVERLQEECAQFIETFVSSRFPFFP